MRAFVVLCLVAVACADHLGYNYQSSGHSNGGAGTPAASYGVPSTHNAPAAEYEKEFYSFSAPEGEFGDSNAAQRAAESVKKALRVIFIKGPENQGLENAALALAKQAGQQQTAIYVLNKQADRGDLANKLNNLNTGNSQKPEVHFVKYRTPQDAANAQSAIQGQYDALGGNSRSVNGGVAPVIDYTGQLPVDLRSPPVQDPQNTYLPSSVFRH